MLIYRLFNCKRTTKPARTLSVRTKLPRLEALNFQMLDIPKSHEEKTRLIIMNFAFQAFFPCRKRYLLLVLVQVCSVENVAFLPLELVSIWIQPQDFMHNLRYRAP